MQKGRFHVLHAHQAHTDYRLQIQMLGVRHVLEASAVIIQLLSVSVQQELTALMVWQVVIHVILDTGATREQTFAQK